MYGSLDIPCTLHSAPDMVHYVSIKFPYKHCLESEIREKICYCELYVILQFYLGSNLNSFPYES
jgi:hypothetical protein